MFSQKNTLQWSALKIILRPQRFRLIVTAVCTMLAALMELIPYWIIFNVINALVVNQADLIEKISHSALIMALALFGKTLSYGLGYYASHRAAFLILLSTRQILLTNLTRLPITAAQQYHSGELKQMIIQDIEKLENFVAHRSVEVATAIFVPLFISGYLFWLDWRLALAAIVCAPLAIISSMLFFASMDKLYDSYREAATTMNTTIIEYLRNVQVIKLFRQSPKVFSNLEQGLDNYYKLVTKMTKTCISSWAFFTCLLSASLLFVLPLGLSLYQSQQINLIELVMVVILSSSMLRPLLKISSFFNEFKELMSGIRRMMPVLLAKKQQGIISHVKQKNMPKLNTSVAEVIFNKVNFSYVNNNLLTDINLTFRAGTTSYIIGESGVGKSTLVQLLSGLLNPSSGQILINTRPINQLTDSERAQFVAIASQDIFLFKASIRENIVFSRGGITDNQLKKAIKTAQLQALITRLPLGLDTIVSESANNLSGGEKQRIALARALLSEAPIIILDEATSYADNLTQTAIYKSIRLTYPNSCVVIISHTIAGIERADQVIVLSEGGVQEAGSPDHMLSTNSTCLHFLAIQSSIDNWTINTPSNNNLHKDLS